MEVITVFVCLTLFNICSAQSTQLINNGYTNVVVAIADYIKQDHETLIINRIKQMFTEASEFIYKATERRAYFKDVTILLPPTWEKKDYMQFSGTEKFNTADVKISDPNPSALNFSYTERMGSTCGAQGKYIHINEDHLLNDNLVNERPYNVTYGPLGRWLTKYWAIYRYGIFEEHGIIGNSEFRTFFKTSNGVRIVTSCSNSASVTSGTKMNFVTGKVCIETDDDRVPSQDCYYDAADDEMKSSIMFAHYHSTVFHFCGVNENFKHDTVPLTLQNKYCKQRSTWEVIMEHEDFKDNKNSPRNISDTTPSFRIVIPNVDRFVLVYDTSVSMNGTRINVFKQVATNFIEDHVPLGSVIGLVAFNKNATTLQEMTKLTSIDDKRNVVKKLTTVTGGNTCIACGLLKAIEILTLGNNSAAGAKIILVSDGNENEKIRISNITELITNHRVQVYSIILGHYSDENLENLAVSTNGKNCFVNQGTESIRTDADSCIFQILADVDLKNVKLVRDVFPSIKTDLIQGRFTVDSNLDDIKFSLMYDTDNSLKNVTLLPPRDSVQYYESNQPNHSKENRKFSTPLSSGLGSWQYFAYFNRTSQNVGISVSGRSSTKETISVEGWLNVRDKKIIAGKDKVTILAKISSACKPIKKAKVIARITLPGGKIIEKRLWDNGTVPDLFKNDGVYSRFFINFEGKGRYGVTLTAKGFDNSGESTFERFVVVGSFFVLNDFYANNQDTIAPNAVSDLKLINFNNKNYEVTLNWTAPGDDYDIGQADKYIIKYSCHRATLKKDFDSISDHISINDVVEGSLSPQACGHSELLRGRILRHLVKNCSSLYIGLKTKDKSNNTAELSNIVKIEILSYPELENCQKIGVKFPNVNDCSQYFVCDHYGYPPKLMNCAKGTYFNPILQTCDWSGNWIHDCYSSK